MTNQVLWNLLCCFFFWLDAKDVPTSGLILVAKTHAAYHVAWWHCFRLRKKAELTTTKLSWRSVATVATLLNSIPSWGFRTSIGCRTIGAIPGLFLWVFFVSLDRLELETITGLGKKVGWKITTLGYNGFTRFPRCVNMYLGDMFWVEKASKSWGEWTTWCFFFEFLPDFNRIKAHLKKKKDWISPVFFWCGWLGKAADRSLQVAFEWWFFLAATFFQNLKFGNRMLTL